jgi:hypothetical protein
MKTTRTFINRHPLITFFAVAYGFSWGSSALLSGLGLFPLALACGADCSEHHTR